MAGFRTLGSNAEGVTFWLVCIHRSQEESPWLALLFVAPDCGAAAEFGRGYSRRNLFNMIRLAEVYPEREIVHALSAQLGWTHLRQIMYIEDPLKRDFYAEMCRLERWSTRTLEKKIAGTFWISSG